MRGRCVFTNARHRGTLHLSPAQVPHHLTSPTTTLVGFAMLMPRLFIGPMFLSFYFDFDSGELPHSPLHVIHHDPYGVHQQVLARGEHPAGEEAGWSVGPEKMAGGGEAQGQEEQRKRQGEERETHVQATPNGDLHSVSCRLHSVTCHVPRCRSSRPPQPAAHLKKLCSLNHSMMCCTDSSTTNQLAPIRSRCRWITEMAT